MKNQVEVSGLIKILGDLQQTLGTSAHRITEMLAPKVNGTDDETFFLYLGSDLNDCSGKLVRAIESLRDYNSRHNLPIP